MAINLAPGQEILIGRRADKGAKIVLQDSTISGLHCSLKCIAPGQYELKDLGSTNGTFVDGLPVVSTRVTLDTDVTLGSYPTKVGILLGFDMSTQKAPGKPQKAVPTVKIGHLEQVYDDYNEAMRDIQKRRAKSQITRMMPQMIGMPIVMGAGAFIPTELIFVKVPLIIACLGFGMVLTLRMPSKSDQLVDDQFDLNDQFKEDYICPNCKNFLGSNVTYRSLMKRGTCHICHCKFVE